MAKSDRDHARRLLGLAVADLTALRHMLDQQSFSEGVFGFHAQQAIEKALKAWIAALALEYPKSHDVSALLRILRSTGADLTPYSSMEDFTVFAVQYRYEAYEQEDKPLNRAEVITKVGSLVAQVERVVSEPLLPRGG